MKATVYHGAHDVRLQEVPDPHILDPRDAIVRVTRAAICGSDLWFYRGISDLAPGARTGHEFIGVVQEVGSEVQSVRPGEPVISPFVSSDGTCEFCREGLQTSCVHVGYFTGERGAQAEFVRVPYADGTLVKMPDAIAHDDAKRNASVALCDVMATGHHGVVGARTTPGSTVVIVGDGAVGLCAVLSAAREVRAERIIEVGHNPKRLEIAKRFGATDTFDSHDANVQADILELTSGGALHVVEAVGNQESLDLAVGVARPGGTVCFVGVPHNVKNPPLEAILFGNLSLRGAVCPARAYLPQLIASLEAGRIDPSPVLDLTLPLDKVADGYAAMDERRAIKVLLTVS
ncbi:MAG TPA: alcohol dehydrogenase catalytic domain-containing protein [Candidatus Eremiobacteraceae bacterium]|nr:alcohol dehydrogenase catalytic domain-containing protein [Candidatus Eremiobacteraceae bacterium]